MMEREEKIARISSAMMEIEITKDECVRQQKLDMLCEGLKYGEHLEHLMEIVWEPENRVVKILYEDHTVEINMKETTNIEMLTKIMDRIHCDSQRAAVENEEEIERTEGMIEYKEVVDHPRYKYKEIARQLYFVLDTKTGEKACIYAIHYKEAVRKACERWRRVFG